VPRKTSKTLAVVAFVAALLGLGTVQSATAAPAAPDAMCWPGAIVTKVKPDLAIDLLIVPCDQRVVLGHANPIHAGDRSWLERADTGPNPTTWVTPISKSEGDYDSAGPVPYENYWWRTCGTYTRDSGTGTYCGKWYHPATLTG
jgi:hypothetical protein